MIREELIIRLRILYQKLEVYRIYKDELIEERGSTFHQKMVDEVLDEVILRKRQLKEITSKNNKGNE